MESLFVIIFLAFLIGMGIFMAKYARVLTAMVNRSNEAGIEIFGAKYKNIYHLMADISFLNTLWAKDCHMQIEDNQLSSLTATAHLMLRTQVYIGFFVFLGPLANAVVNAGA